MKRLTLAAAIAIFGVTPAFALLDGSNLIKNGDAEAGPFSTNGGAVSSIPDWTIDSMFGVARYADSWYEQPGNPANTNQGLQFFNGASQSGAATVRIRQTLDMSSESATIDRGLARFKMSGWFGGWNAQEDTMGLTAIFKDASDAVLSEVTIGNPTAADRGSEAKTLYYEALGVIAANTRSIEFVLASTKAAGGSSNDGAADNLTFEAVPEPGTMIALGAGALALMRRRKAR